MSDFVSSVVPFIFQFPAIRNFLIYTTPAFVLSVNAAIPGRVLPSINSREAPPPVEIWESFSSRPACETAAAESPPPTIVTAPLVVSSARSSAIAIVPVFFVTTGFGRHHVQIYL